MCGHRPHGHFRGHFQAIHLLRCSVRLPEFFDKRSRGVRLGLKYFVYWVGLGRIGLDRVGLGWVGKNWIGLGCIGSDWVGLGWVGFGPG